MKKIYWLGLVAFVLMAGKCGAPAALPSAVYGKTWLHAYEEDSADVRTYRPNTYDFPPSRGRTGFAVQENGTFVRYGIAPTDGLEEQPGRWQPEGKKRLKVTFKDARHTPETLELLEVSEEKITLRLKEEQP